MENNNQTTTTISADENQNIYDLAINQLADGRSNNEVAEMMIQQGIEPNHARSFVPQLKVQMAQARLDHANKEMRNGALWCLGGLAITVVTYSMASGGGSYMLCWGPIIFGGIQFFRGLSKVGSAKDELASAGGVTEDAEAQEVKYLE